VKGWRLLGRIAVARGEPDDAEDALRRALAIAQAIGNPPQLWATHAAIGDLHAARHRPEAARVAYRAACGVVDQVRAGLSDPRLRAALERASFVRELTAQAASPA
jgi:tellurite resistance protein